MSTVSTVAKAATAASSVTAVSGLISDAISSNIALCLQLRASPVPQYLKLIIFFITSRPQTIQEPAVISMMLPAVVVQSDVMKLGVVM